MKAFEFAGSLNAEGTLTVPPEILAQLQREQAIRVLLLIPDSSEESAWASLTADQFLAGYAESDALYDQGPAE